MKMFYLWLYAYQTKAMNPRNTVAATNPLFGLLMTSNDLNDLHKWKFLTMALCININVLINDNNKLLKPEVHTN